MPDAPRAPLTQAQRENRRRLAMGDTDVRIVKKDDAPGEGRHHVIEAALTPFYPTQEQLTPSVWPMALVECGLDDYGYEPGHHLVQLVFATNGPNGPQGVCVQTSLQSFCAAIAHMFKEHPAAFDNVPPLPFHVDIEAQCVQELADAEWNTLDADAQAGVLAYNEFRDRIAHPGEAELADRGIQ